jgi:hypothetical protein
MYLTVHSAIGAAASQFAPSPLVAFILGFILHFVFDTIPHGDEWIKKIRLFKTNIQNIVFIGSIDFIITIIMTLCWIKFTPIDQVSLLFASIAGSVAPDVIWGLYEMTQTPILAGYKKFHASIHKIFTKKELPTKQGFVFQFALLAIATLMIVLI